MLNLNRSLTFNRRVLSIGSPKVSRKSWISRWIRCYVVIGSVISFSLAICAGYIYVLPNLTQAFHGDTISKIDASNGVCDVFDGNWIMYDRYPLYNASGCPFAEQGFNCLGNGRVDRNYLKWTWKPKNCEIPRFDVQSILEMLRSKRIVFVGDSMSRTQWESLICLLMSGVEDKRSVYEVNGNKITKTIRYLGVRFSSFNFTIEFFRSVFLVQHNWAPGHAPKRVRSTLKLDKLDDISKEWIDADVLIFNSGQWWVPGKLFEMGCYFQVQNSVKLGMSINAAFRKAMNTWASWIETVIDPNKTRVFFRTFEPSHWSNQTFRLCKLTHEPELKNGGKEHSPFSDTIFEVVNNMAVPVTVLHITPMAASRRDAHVGTWGDNPSFSDCSHWCLPGLPDTWNEILLSYLFDSMNNYTKSSGKVITLR